jgi:hypothetical protein
MRMSVCDYTSPSNVLMTRCFYVSVHVYNCDVHDSPGTVRPVWSFQCHVKWKRDSPLHLKIHIDLSYCSLCSRLLSFCNRIIILLRLLSVTIVVAVAVLLLVLVIVVLVLVVVVVVVVVVVTLIVLAIALLILLKLLSSLPLLMEPYV